MPELPEVETIVRDLQDLTVGRKIKNVRVRLGKLVRTGPRRLARHLKGTEILAVRRRGKFIVFHLSQDRYLVVHLKMTGQFLWSRASGPWPDHVHLAVDFEDASALWYRDMRQFGYFLGFDETEFQKWLVTQPLGPDPFDLGPQEFAGLVTARRGRIKAVLLDQKIISGLGNIYVDESLFAAGIHPERAACSLDPALARDLHGKILDILSRAIARRGSTTRNYVGLKGVGGSFQNEHRVYGKDGQPCPICGQIIAKSNVAGRGTHFCPGCQHLDCRKN